MSKGLNIFDRFKLGFGVILLITIISTTFNIYNLDRNTNTNNRTINVIQPTAVELDKLYDLISESKLLIKNWVYIEKKPETFDKRRLSILHLKEFPIIDNNIKYIYLKWDEEDKVKYNKLNREIRLLFELHTSIMKSLNSFESYNDLTNVILAQNLVDENGEINTLTDKILIDLGILRDKYLDMSDTNIKEMNNNFDSYRWFILINGLALSGLILIVGSSVNSSLRVNIQNRETAEKELKHNKEELENIVESRTYELKNKVSERIDIQAELEREKVFVDKIINNLPGTFYLTNKNNKIIRWNNNFQNLTGFDDSQITESSPYKFIDQVDAIRLQYNHENVFNNEQINTEVNFINKNGEKVPYLITVIRYDFEDEFFFVSFGINISTRKKAEKALLESQARYKKFFENIFDAVMILNPSGKVIEFNNSARILFDNKHLMFNDFNIHEIFQNENKTRINNLINDLQRNPNRIINEELEIVNFSGVKIDTDLKASLIDLESEKHILMILKDISQSKKFEKERAKFVDELEKKNTELERFTYTVSHDLKSPLITIKGFLGVLANEIEEVLTPSTESYIKRIKNAADNMQDLLEDLLELSRIGRLVNQSEKVDLNSLLENTLELLHAPIHNRNVKIEVGKLPHVVIDKQRMGEVFQNLIENAIKYIGDENQNPKIEINCETKNDLHYISIKDNGIGIHPDYHEKIFSLFDQLNKESDGTGVGLALVKRIVEFHDGKIWVESDGPGTGSNFVFTLPSKKLN